MNFLRTLTVLALVAAALSTPNAAAQGGDASNGGEGPQQIPDVLPTPPLQPLLSDVLPARTAGADAIDLLSDSELADVATQNGQSVEAMTDILVNDSTAWLDADGMLLYIEAEPPAPPAGYEGGPPEQGPFPNSQTFLLHSRPSSPRKLFIDFDGYNLPAGTVWNGGAALVVPRWDLDGNLGSWSQTELDWIQSVWQRVAEDYAPFDIDVTTQDPGYAAINRSSVADNNYGTRVVIHSNMGASTPCNTGCSYLGIIDNVGAAHDFRQPAWINGAHPQYIASLHLLADTVSHESGHSVGLSHDGEIPGDGDYYQGHGMWAPIMGYSRYEPVTQWSRGEYTNATNTENDYAVMLANGVTEIADDETSCGIATPNTLVEGATRLMNDGDDCDAWKYTAPCTGTYTVTVNVAPVSPNLSVQMNIWNWGGTFIKGSAVQPVEVNADLATGMGETTTVAMTAGNAYTIAVFGNPNGTPSTGWSNFNNGGNYSVDLDNACANNNFANAYTIGGPDATVTGNNTGFTAQAGEPDPTCDFGSPTGPSAWWNWTAPSTGRVNINTIGSDFDTVLAVYTGNTVSTLNEVACNDQNGVDNTSEVSFNATAGTTYRIQVDGWFGQTGNIVLNTRPTPVIRPYGVVVNPEGDTGSQVVQAKVFLEDANGDPYSSPTPVTVNWATGDIPPNPAVAHPGSDFVAASGSLTFAPGQTEALVPIEILGDTVDEPPLLYGEWGLINFNTPSANAKIDTATFFGVGLFIIIDDD